MVKRSTEISVGLFMLAGLVALFFLAMKVSNLGSKGTDGGYLVTAHFQNVGSLKEKSPVTIAGVRVGRVQQISFNEKTFEAVATLYIEPRYDQLPKDTFAKILTAGLLGEQYIGLDPGGSEQFLEPGDKITMTQSALVLEDIIGQAIFNQAEGGGNAF